MIDRLIDFIVNMLHIGWYAVVGLAALVVLFEHFR